MIIILVGLGVIFHSSLGRQLNDWKLLPQPEKLTELFFSNPNTLPKKYMPGMPQPISFTVHNLEYQPYKYYYQIVERSKDGSQTQVLQAGDISLNQNQYAKKILNITPADLGNRVKLSVEITNINESIDYWMNRGTN